MKKINEEKTRIYIDEDRIEVVGKTPELLMLYAQITENMYKLKGVNDSDVKLAFDMAKMSQAEVKDLYKKKIDELLDKISNIFDDEDEDE